jgi:hypothetical protein
MYDHEYDINRLDKIIDKIKNTDNEIKINAFESAEEYSSDENNYDISKKCFRDGELSCKYQKQIYMNKYIDTYTSIMELMETHTKQYFTGYKSLGINIIKINHTLNKYNLKHLDHHLQNKYIKEHIIKEDL